MMLLTFLTPFLLLLGITLADPLWLTPTPGEKVDYQSFTISWLQNGLNHLNKEFSRYEIQLCAGGNTAAEYVCIRDLMTIVEFAMLTLSQANLTTLVSSNSQPKPQSTTVSIPRNIGDGSATDAYFLKFISHGPKNRNFTVTNFSSRFSIPGLDGKFPSKVSSGLSTVQGSLIGPQSFTHGTAPTADELDTSLKAPVIAAIAVVAVIVCMSCCFAVIMYPHLRRRRPKPQTTGEFLGKGIDDGATPLAAWPGSMPSGGSTLKPLPQIQTKGLYER